MDPALAEALRMFRELIQNLDAAQTTSAVRRTHLHNCHEHIDHGLRDLIEDAVQLCRNKLSPVYRQLLRHNANALCAVARCAKGEDRLHQQR
jgi:hypothetical protein